MLFSVCVFLGNFPKSLRYRMYLILFLYYRKKTLKYEKKKEKNLEAILISLR